jgi:molybdenum cofactor guanylyltransferase
VTDVNESTVGVVLAGGRSRRMGRDKAMLSWQGDTLLTHMQRCLRLSGVSRVIVSGAYSHCDAVPDRFADLGPLGGLASVSAALPDTTLLIVPVDMPLISAAALRYLREFPAAGCVCFEDQPLPMRLRLDQVSRQLLAALLKGPASGRSLRALHTALNGKRLPLPVQWQAQLQDADTPADWHAMTTVRP